MFLKKIVKSLRGDVLSEKNIEVTKHLDKGELCYVINNNIYVPESHLNRDFISADKVVRWELIKDKSGQK